MPPGRARRLSNDVCVMELEESKTLDLDGLCHGFQLGFKSFIAVGIARPLNPKLYFWGSSG